MIGCNHNSGQSGKSDENLSKGWYRFVSGAGGEIPTTAPSPGECSTIIPIWINGMCIYTLTDKIIILIIIIIIIIIINISDNIIKKNKDVFSIECQEKNCWLV